MSKWNLPTFDGDKDRVSARQMIDNLGGANGIRTKIISDGMGGETMLRTRNGFPEITTKKPEQKSASDFSLWHGIVVDVAIGTETSSLFYTRGSEGAREKRVPNVFQSGTFTYNPESFSNIYSLTKDGLGLWDLSKKTMTTIPASTAMFSYASAVAKNGSELAWSLPNLYGTDYFLATPTRVIGSNATQVTTELSVPNIGSEELTPIATPPVITKDGKAHLCAYKTKVISQTAGISQYNWSSIAVQRTGDAFVESPSSTSETAPVLLDRTVTSDVGVGALSSYDPVVWFVNVLDYPGGFTGGYSFGAYHCIIRGGIATQATPALYANGGWHDSTQETVRCAKTVTVDTVPVKFSINANYDSDYKAQRAMLTERVAEYYALTIGYGISIAYTSLHTIDYSQTGSVVIKAMVGDVEVELLKATGNAVATGKDNWWEKLADVRQLPPTFFYAGDYYFVANGSPLPPAVDNGAGDFAALQATFDEMPSVYPCTELWNAQYGGTPLPTVYQAEKFHGSASIEATGFYVTDCDQSTGFTAGIECEVKVSASFVAPAGDGVWDMGASFVFDHEVSIYFSWHWRGVKSRKTLITTVVRKPPPFPVRQRMNPFVEDTDSTPIYHLTFPEFKMGSEAFDQLVGLRNHQGVNPCYAGHSTEEEAVSSLNGLAQSTATTRASKSGAGMIYTRTFAKGDLNNCVWLLERLGIANPLSSAPLETDPALLRPYGYSNALYQALTDTEYKIHLVDGVESDWPSTLIADPSATFTCKRV